MIGLILDTLIIVGVISISIAIIWIDTERRVQKRKERKKTMKKLRKDMDKFNR